jgi:tetratricopeptide (TPR) repeat protein
MSDAAPIPDSPPEPTKAPPIPRKPGLMADPVVKVMVYCAIGLVILFLATVVGVLGTGVISPSGPRSLGEKQVMVASAQVKGAVGEAMVPYVDALIATGDLSAARVALAQARASLPATGTAFTLDLAEARLLSAGGDYAKAIPFADKTMKGNKAKYDALVAKGGEAAAAAKDAGYGDDYYDAALVKAYALVELRRFKDAIPMFDIYIRTHPTASDILVDRGNAKAEVKDKAGAEKDFREALRFVPYDEQAKAGLKKIGAAQ